MKFIRTYEEHSVDWERLGLGADRRDYRFTINDIEYRVYFSSREGTASLFFYVRDGEFASYNDLEKSNPFKTMKVITDIVKDFIENNPKVDKIIFSGIRSKEEIPKGLPEWLLKLISSNTYLHYLATSIDTALIRPKLWISRPSKRTKMFNRIVNREVKDTNWKAKRIGNEIQLIRNSSI
jgi:hypothetical protein